MSCPTVLTGLSPLIPTFRSALVLLIAEFMIPGWTFADVVPLMPERIVVEDMDTHGDLVFVLFLDGQFDRGVLFDPKTAERLSGTIRLPSSAAENLLDNQRKARVGAAKAKGFPELPVGHLSLLGVPRGLVGEGRGSPDPAWLHGGVPETVRVTGFINHYPVEQSRVLHQYKLEKADDGLKITMLNPDALTPYPAEKWILDKKWVQLVPQQVFSRDICQR